MGVVGMDLNHATPELITSWFYRKNKQIPKVYMIFFEISNYPKIFMGATEKPLSEFYQYQLRYVVSLLV